MLYPFMTLNDDTEIVHSETLPDGSVKVCVETPVDGGFHHMTVYLPEYRIAEVSDYTFDDMEKYMKLIRLNSHLIIRFAAGGGFENAPPV